jgi:hypothetical protein
LTVSAEASDLRWRDGADLVQRRAAVERWAQVGKELVFRPKPWWQLILIVTFVVTPLIWLGLAMTIDQVLPDNIVEALALGGPVAVLALMWRDEHRKRAAHRAALPARRPPCRT